MRELVGISIVWLGLGMLFDGLNTIVVPARLIPLTDEGSRATMVGLLTFVAIVVAMAVQPFAGGLSDRLRPRYGRLPFIAVGILATLLALGGFAAAATLPAIAASYVAALAAASVAQAGQQGLIPDRVPGPRRGLASGTKNLMDLSGALIAFALLGSLLEGGIVPAVAALAVALIVTFAVSAALVRERRGAVDAAAARERPGRGFARVVASRFLFLLATYAIGRFFLLFIGARLELAPEQAAEGAGALLAAITLATVLAALPAGWLADRLGRRPLVAAGAALSATGAIGLIPASTEAAILVAGLVLAAGSAAFVGANWALTVDLAPAGRSARALGVANLGTGGAAAAAGLFGPLVDALDRLAPGTGYPGLFTVAAALFVAGGMLGWSAGDREANAMGTGTLGHAR